MEIGNVKDYLYSSHIPKIKYSIIPDFFFFISNTIFILDKG